MNKDKSGQKLRQVYLAESISIRYDAFFFSPVHRLHIFIIFIYIIYRILHYILLVSSWHNYINNDYDYCNYYPFNSVHTNFRQSFECWGSLNRYNRFSKSRIGTTLSSLFPVSPRNSWGKSWKPRCSPERAGAKLHSMHPRSTIVPHASTCLSMSFPSPDLKIQKCSARPWKLAGKWLETPGIDKQSTVKPH